MKIAITGNRNIQNPDIIYDVMAEVLTSADVDEVLFGGAKGVDSYALQYCYDIIKETGQKCVLSVIVPFTIDDQPKSSISIIKKCSDNVIEMKQDFSKFAYLRRNNELVNRADLVIAFWDGKDGGTKYTIKKAKEMNKPVEIVRLDEELVADEITTADNKIYYYFPTEDVFVLEPFSRHTTLGGKIMALKQYKKVDVDAIARDIISILKNEGVYEGVLLAVPRRTIGKKPSVAPILAKIEEISNGKFLNFSDGLLRVKELTGGPIVHYRERYSGEEHAESMDIAPALKEYSHLPAIVIDDVITQGGSMKGAKMVAKKIFNKVIGIALAAGGKFSKAIADI